MTEGQTLICLGLLAVASVVVTSINLDRLMRSYCEQENESWIRDGSPVGIFWYPKGDGHHFFLGIASDKNRARNRLAYAWLYSTPEWIKRSGSTLKFVRNYRIGTFTGVFFSLGMGVCIIF